MAPAQRADESELILARTDQAIIDSQVVLGRVKRLLASEQADVKRALALIEASKKLMSAPVSA